MQNFLLSIVLIIGVLLSGCNKDKVTVPKLNTKTPVALASAKHKASFSDVVSEIKAKLFSTQELKYCKVMVSQEEKNIILSGQVYTKKQRFLASSVARSVQGSGRVINRLVMP